MILVVFVGISAALVPVLRGRLLNLAQLKFQRSWLLLVALGMQLPLILVAGPRTPLREITYVASYIVAIWFLYLNRRVPGIWLIAFGAGLNLIAITANGGVMPASPHALASAGLPTQPSHDYINSMAMQAPRLAFLGDIFAIPRSWPLSNVFSAGDICIALGAAVAIHRVSGSGLVPSGTGQFAPLFRRRTFMRLWSAQAISNLGDWTYALAVAKTLVDRTHSPEALSLLLIAQVAPAAVFGGILSALPDRHSRIKLMVGADLISALAVGSLLIGSPSVPHIYAVAALLGIFGALFQPSMRACVPNVVEKDQVVAANAMVGSTFNFAIMAGPAIGGILVAALGATPVFAINALSFIVSASLIAGIRISRTTPEPSQRRSAFRDVIEGARYSLTTPLVRGLLMVIGVVLMAAASKAPLESLFILGTLSLGPEALGLIMGSWGLGMLLGSVAAPAICRRWARERVLALMILTVGMCVIVASQAHDLQTVLLAWLVAGAANSIANVSYESVLQERTPDEFRGRVFAAFQFVTNVAFLSGAFLAGWLGTHFGIRLSYMFSGGLFFCGALLCRVLLGDRRARKAVFVGFGAEAEPAPVPRIDKQERRVRIAAPPMPLPIATAATAPSVPARVTPVEPVPVFTSSNSIFSGSESVFAMAERESGFDSHMPDAPFVRPLPPIVASEPDTEPEPEHLVFRPAQFVEPDPAAFEATPIEPELEEFWPKPDLGDLSALDESEEEPASEAPLDVEVPDDPSELITSFDPADRLRAVELAAASMDDPIVATILKALADPSPQVRRRAAEEVGRLRITDAGPALDHAVDDPDDSVRVAAVEALAELAGEEALASIVRALGDPSEHVRRAATSVLVLNGSESVAHLLCQALASHPLRRAAVEALSQIGPVAVDPIVDMLAGANGLRPTLGAALAKVAGPSRFAEDLSRLDPSVRRRAVEALGAIGGSDGAAELVRALIDPEPDVRRRAAELLGELGDPVARDDLERTCYDPVDVVSVAARHALAKLDSGEPALA